MWLIYVVVLHGYTARKKLIIMFWKILLVVAFIGVLWAIFERLWDCVEAPLARLVSLFIPGLLVGIVLAGVMIIGEFLCICSDMYIFGFHPFWLGFCIGSGWYILRSLIDWLKYR